MRKEPREGVRYVIVVASKSTQQQWSSMARTRRVLGVLVASGLISTGLLGGTAFAGDQDLSVRPSYGPNNSSSAQTLTFTTTGANFESGAIVTLTGVDQPHQVIKNSSPSQA